MRHYTPTLHLYDEVPPRTITDKLGGEPEGFPQHLWPHCSECGAQQGFLAQFDHDLDRLDLGRAGRRLYLFQCSNPAEVGMCETWFADSGANAALIVEPEDLTLGLTSPPRAKRRVVKATDEPELLIGEWQSVEVPQAGDSPFATKLGGAPAWIQHEEVDPSQWRFLGQLRDYHTYVTAHEDLLKLNPDGGLPLGNFGTGLSYFFIERKPAEPLPKAIFLWQC